VCCRKDVDPGEPVSVEFIKRTPEKDSMLKAFIESFKAKKETSVQRGSTGFNGAIAYCLNMEAFETRMDKVNNDCEMFAQCGPVQVGVRKQGKPGFFFDYPVGLNIVIINGTTQMYEVNVFRYYKVTDTRWRISINGTDIIEFDMNTVPTAGMIGFGMADKGSIKTIIWDPAFMFQSNGIWRPADECYVNWGQRGGINGRPVNHVEGGDNITTTSLTISL